jgi:NitT/TauT family transport system permease protein
MRLADRFRTGSPAEGLPSNAAIGRDFSGLDSLELAESSRPRSRGRDLFHAAWPKLAAIAIAIGFWQFATLFYPAYLLPGPVATFGELGNQLLNQNLLSAVAVTMQRAAIGFAVALVIGVVVGLLVSKSRVLRSAIGSLITGLQTMPSIAWFPLAILLFKLSETAILFVVVLGAAPAIANGVISGIDQVPPVLLRAGRVLGARGWSAYRHVIIPAALPGFVGGLKQGWAFAWRSLMAGELLVIVAGANSIGVKLQVARELTDAPWLVSVMVVILAIGILVDALIFGQVEKGLLQRRGLIDTSAAQA